ncbi:MAG: response regulator [Patescibacteria group bacterium]|nr:response regulator [Patescibacteria group bacterium]
MTKKFIIVAEDDKAYIGVYKSKLTSEGYEVVVVDQGDLVIPELHKRKPDLLILDLMLPQKTGFEILGELRANSKLKGIKVVVASNLSQDVDKERVKKLGALDYFIKSEISIFELVDKIKKALEC